MITFCFCIDDELVDSVGDDDVLGSNNRRELEFVDDDEELVYEELVFREEDDSKFEQRLDESSISVNSLPDALLVFSTDRNDSFVSEAIDDFEELRIFFACWLQQINYESQY